MPSKVPVYQLFLQLLVHGCSVNTCDVPGPVLGTGDVLLTKIGRNS